MEDKEIFPAEGPEHFRGFIDNIKNSKDERTAVWWHIIDQVGNELSHSIEQGKVNQETAEEFRQEIEDFMNEGDNVQQYKAKLSVLEGEPSFWWKKRYDK